MSERETVLESAPGDPLRVRESATAVTIALTGHRRVTVITPHGAALEVWPGAIAAEIAARVLFYPERRRPPEIVTHGFPWRIIAATLYGLTCFAIGVVFGVSTYG